MKKLLSLAASSAVICLATAPVMAQSIDYSTMEELFGEPVTTSANGSPQRVSEVALNMEILTAKDIERTGARTIPEALRFVPGVDVRQYSVGQYEVGIRGYNQAGSERILVLVNGRQVYTDFFGQVVWDGIPVEMSEIKQIEVVKGPNTALFGFNAVSGVINVITYNPLYDDRKSATLTVGSNSLHEASGSLTHKIHDNLGLRVSGHTSKATSDFDDVEDARSSSTGEDISGSVDDTTTESVVLDLWAQLTDRVQAQLEITKNDSARNEFIVIRSLTSTEYDTSSIRGRILADTSWGLIEADLYHNEVRADYAFGDAALQADNRITVAKLNDTFQLGADHTFRLAGEYRAASNIFSSDGTDIDENDLTYEIWSGSTLWDWKATDKLRTSVALRFDSFELEPDGDSFLNANMVGLGLPTSAENDFYQKREEFSYNLGVSYAVDSMNTLRATSSRGADLPSFTEFGFQFLSEPTATSSYYSTTFGDPNVDTSIVTNHELGWDHKMDSINGQMRSAIFYQYNDEMQSFGAELNSIAAYVPLGSAQLEQSYITNIGDSEMYGAELGFEGLYDDKWNWAVNYTYVEIQDDLNNAQTSADRSAVAVYEDSVVNHILNASLGYTADTWTADVFAQYRTSFDDVVDVDASTANQLVLREVDDEFIVNANFAYNINDQLTWSVSGTSIFGDTQQTLESEAEAVVWSSLKYKF